MLVRSGLSKGCTGPRALLERVAVHQEDKLLEVQGRALWHDLFFLFCPRIQRPQRLSVLSHWAKVLVLFTRHTGDENQLLIEKPFRSWGEGAVSRMCGSTTCLRLQALRMPTFLSFS